MTSFEKKLPDSSNNYLFNQIGEYNSEPKSVKKNIPVSGIIIKGSKK
jgi:hypothetical protein